MTTPNFRINLSVDSTAARRALAQLEAQFSDLSINIGDTDEVNEDFKELSRSVGRLGKGFADLERAFRGFAKDADNNAKAVTEIINAVERLDRESRESRAGVRELGEAVGLLGKGLSTAVNAIQKYATASNALEKGSPRQITHLTRDLRQLNRAMQETDIDLSDLATDLKDTAKSFNAVNSALTRYNNNIDRLNARTGDENFDQLAREIQQFNSVLRDSAVPLEALVKDLRELASGIRALDRALEKFRGNQVVSDFKNLADGIERLRSVMRSAEGDSVSWVRELHDLADAIRAVDRAQDLLNRNTIKNEKVGAGGRTAARSAGRPLGFLGLAAGGGFLGIGGTGLNFAAAAAGAAIFTQLTQAIFAAGRAMFEFTRNTAELGAQFDLLIRRADIIAGGGALEAFQALALAEGKRTIFTVNEAAEALGELAKAGFDAEEAASALPATLDLAATDALSLADATLIVARQTRSFGLEADQASRVADILAQTAASSATSVSELAQAMKFSGPVAAQLRIPIEEVAAAVGVMSDQGQVAGLAGRSLRFALGALVSPTDKQAEAFGRLGITTIDTKGNFTGLYEITRQLTIAQKNAGTQAEFVGDVFDAFGKNAAPRILSLVEGFDEFGEAIERNFGAFGTAAEIAEGQLAGLEGAMERIRGEVEAQQIELFDRTGFEQALTGLLQDTEKAIPVLFHNIVDPIFGEIATGVNLLRTNMFPKLIDASAPVGESIAETIGDVFSAINTQSDNIIVAIQAIVDALGGIVDGFIGLGAIVLPIVGAIGDLLAGIPQELSSALSAGAFGALIGGVGGPVGSAIGGVVGTIVGAVGGAITSAAPSIEEEVAQFATDFSATLTAELVSGVKFADAVTAALEEEMSKITINHERMLALDEQFEGDTRDLFGDVPTDFPALRARVEALQELSGDIKVAAAEIALAEIDDRGLTSQVGNVGKALDAIEGTFEGTDFTQFERMRDELEALGIRTTGELRTYDQIQDFARDALASTTEEIAILGGRLDEVLNRPEIVAGIDDAIRRANKFKEGLEARGDIDLSELFEVEEFKSDVLLNALLLPDAEAALLRDGIPVPLQEARQIWHDSVIAYEQEVQTSVQKVVDATDEAALLYLSSLERFRTSISEIDFGEAFFAEVPDIEAQFRELLSIDFATVFEPVNEDDEAILATATTVANAFRDIIALIPGEELQAELSEKIGSILGDTDLTLAEQQIAGAFLIDQTVQADMAQKFADDVTAIFDSANAKIEAARKKRDAAQLAINELPRNVPDALVSPVRHIPAELQAQLATAEEQLTTAERAATVLQDLVTSGATALASIAAVDDEVLASVIANSDRLAETEQMLADLEIDVEQEVNIVADEESIANLTAFIIEQGAAAAEALGEEFAGVEVIQPILDQLGGQLPAAITDEVTAAMEAFTGASGFDTGSPSKKTKKVGQDVADGLLIGWDIGFTNFEFNVVTDINRLVDKIELLFRNIDVNLDIPTPSGGFTGHGSGLPQFHSGGLLPGTNEYPILAQGGEFMLRRSTVASLARLGVNLETLNRDPRSLIDPITHQYGTTNASYDNSTTNTTHHEHHWNVTGAPNIDERKIRREFEKTISRKVRI